jgi:hypothetical protein
MLAKTVAAIKNWILPYQVTVRYWGCIVSARVNADGMLSGTDVVSSKPRLDVYRFYSARRVEKFAERYCFSKFKKESRMTFSGDYYQD